MLKVCRKRVDAAREERGDTKAEYVEAIAENIPLPDNTFDRVFCLFSFRDFKDKKKGLEEIHRVLKPGGQLVICDAGKANWLHGIFGRIYMATFVQWVARYVTKRSQSSLEMVSKNLHALRNSLILQKNHERNWI